MSEIPYHHWTHRPKNQGGTDPIESLAEWPVKIFSDAMEVEVTSGEDAFVWEVPEDLHGCELLKVEAFVTTSGATVEVGILNRTTANEMLSTVVTIDGGDLNSKDSATPHVVDLANNVVSWGDHLEIHVDAAGGKGLGVHMYFKAGVDSVQAVSGPTGAEGPEGPTGPTGSTGPQGDPGGITAFTGEWVTATGYTAQESVSHLGSSYAAIDNHTSGATSEPGVGANWEDHWQLLASGGSSDAVDIDIADAGTYFTSTDVEGALQELGAAMGGGGLFDAYALLSDVKSAGTDGGTFTSGAWRTRDLNTEVDPDGIVTLSSNQFALAAGTYFIKAQVPGYAVTFHKAKLRNITDSTDDLIGTACENNVTSSRLGHSFIAGRITIAGTKTFEIQHQCSVTETTDGFGRAAGFSLSEVYTQVEIWREP